MGVQEVNVGDAVTPVWRKIGCPAAYFIEAATDGGTSGNTKTLTFDGIDEGDLLIAFGATIDDTVINAVPSGWTLHRVDVNASGRFGNSRAYIYTRTATSADVASPTYPGWDVDKNSTWTLTGVQYRGPGTIQASAVNAYGYTAINTWQAPTVTASSDAVLLYVAQADYSVTPSATGMTARSTLGGASGFTSQHVFDEDVSSGATGTRATTGSGSSEGQVQALVIDRPAVTGRLKLWTGPEWVRERCDDDPPLSITLLEDTFDRADSGTLGTASDGGAWTFPDWSDFGVIPQVLGIASNRAYSVANPNIKNGAYRDSGQIAADVNLTFHTTGYYRGLIYFAMDLTGGSGYGYFPWGSTKCIYRWTTTNTTTWTQLGASDGAPTTGTVIRVTYDGAGEIKVYWDGVLKQTINDGTPLAGAGNTWVGFGSSQNFSATGETWDDFTADGVTNGRPLKVNVGTPDTPDWQTVACMVPV